MKPPTAMMEFRVFMFFTPCWMIFYNQDSDLLSQIAFLSVIFKIAAKR